ncbi:MAG: TetR/AcrR family transcriptional regulator [Solirubrobacterales bacterium]|nr:TetR/AcrR family transcriptional regulator [Solirubrobacterales bacterium]
MPREQRKQLILDVAGQAFAAAGYAAASMDEIADGAGVSKPMLYAYFGSKEGLYLAYIRRSGGELVERLVAAAPADDASTAGLQARIIEFLAFVQERADGWKVLFREVVSTRPVADQVAVVHGRIVDAVRRLIESSRPSGAPPASAAIAEALVGAGESLANWWLEHPEVEREQVADWYLSVVQGVVAGPSAPLR